MMHNVIYIFIVIIFGCTEIKEYKSNKSKYDMYIIFNDSKIIEYLYLNNNIVASEIPHNNKK